MISHFLRVIPSVIFFFALFAIGIGCKGPARDNPAGKDNNQLPLEKLLAGNDRFSQLRPIHPDADPARLREAARGQHPFAVVVSCSDSRLSPELIFDQGVGDLFVIRTAGHILGGLEIGSIEYAVEHLGVKLVLVMGHENCGAVQAYLEGGEAHGHIRDLVDSLGHESEIQAVSIHGPNRLDDCVKANVQHGIHQLQTQSEIIREKLAKREIQLIGARYDLDNYTVALLNQ